MLRTQPGRSTLCALRRPQSRCLPATQHFASSSPVAAISPHRNSTPSSPKVPIPEVTKRGQSTAAATAPYVFDWFDEHFVQLDDHILTYSRQTRPIPSPAFNQEPSRNQVHPLQNMQMPEMDDS